MNRRTFNNAVNTDAAYVENLIGSAINSMRDAKNTDGARTYKYHNLSSVTNFINKYYNIKPINASINSVNTEQTKKAKASYKLFCDTYRKSASRYKSAGKNNFSFEAKKKLGYVLLKAVDDLLRVK